MDNLEQKKEEYWNYFLTLKTHWGYGVTLKKLEKIKLHIWADKDFWNDILVRHGGLRLSPEEMKNKDNFNYEHCFGNFAGMLYKELLEKKLVKP